MAEGADGAGGATPAKGVPPGLPVGWIAPESAIMDLGDLAEMRDALRAGKTVTVASDGHVYVSAEPTGPPMTTDAEDFIESKLGIVREMVLMGGGMTIRPDGRMAGSFAQQHVKVVLGPDRQLDADERNLVHTAILSGATVAVLPDGSVQYVLDAGAKAPDGVRAKQIIDMFEEEVRSGRFTRALEEGRVVRVVGDGYEEFDLPQGRTPPGFPFPEPGEETRDVEPPPAPPPPETVDVDLLHDPVEMTRLSDELDARAATLRDDMARRLETETVRLGTERDTVARRQWGAQQEAAAAKQQVQRELRIQKEERTIVDRLESEARALEAKGDAAGAAERREEARVHLGREAAAGDRARAADDERARLEGEAAQLGSKVEKLEAQIQSVNDSVKPGEQALDAMEQRARLLDAAAGHLAEARRLENEAEQARADGDTTVATDIQRAADHVASLGYDALAQADRVVIDLGAVSAATGAPPPAAPVSVTARPSTVGVVTGPAPVDLDDPVQGGLLVTSNARAAETGAADTGDRAGTAGDESQPEVDGELAASSGVAAAGDGALLPDDVAGAVTDGDHAGAGDDDGDGDLDLDLGVEIGLIDDATSSLAVDGSAPAFVADGAGDGLGDPAAVSEADPGGGLDDFA